ncbi:MAG: class I SAM-dependent methyltransferase [Promethearchaeota archaeon]
MSKIEPFDKYYRRYDEWFETNRFVYLSELNAIKSILPDFENAIEVGVGTGRFAIPLGIKLGVEPSEAMRKIAEERGVKVLKGVGEALPFDDGEFDLVLLVTTICFVDNLDKVFLESNRILREGGSLVVGFVDSDSPLGKKYIEKREENVFYREANFFSTSYVITHLKMAGFRIDKVKQTIFRPLSDINELEKVEDGSGRGGFIVIKAVK